MTQPEVKPGILPAMQQSVFARFKGAVLSLVLPQACLACSAPVRATADEDWPICPACAHSLARLPLARCPVCALPTMEALICGACQAHPPAFDGTAAPLIYAFPADRLIQSLKYRQQLALSGWFGSLLAEEFCRYFTARPEAGLEGARPDVILPMPLHPRRLAERGFNQAVELARPLSRITHVPMLLEGVERSVNAPPQASLPWKERRKNIRGAFACLRDFTGLHVLVVDDVMTTGATLEEIALCLKNGGAARVTNLVLARTLPHGSA